MQYGKNSSWIWLSLLSLTMTYVSTQATTLDPVTMRQVLPAYAVLENVDLLNSSRCRTEVDEFRNAVDNQIFWGLRALDTSGVPSEGFINGNNYWLGDRLVCTNLSVNRTLLISEEKQKNDSIYQNPNEEYPPFEFRFFIARMRHYSTVQYHVGIEDEDLITLGLCLPASCSKRDVATMVDKILHDETLLIGKLFAIHFRLIEVSDLTNDYQWLLSAKMISILGVLLLLCVIVVAATIYDVFVHRKRSKNERICRTVANNIMHEVKNEIGDKCETVDEEPATQKSKQQNGIGQYLLCFSFTANVKQIFKQQKGADGFRIFHGMKILGTLILILYHTATYSGHVLGNKARIASKDDLFGHVITNLVFVVDTFFFISGFLLSYTFLNGQRKQKGTPPIAERINEFIQKIVKRYIRLTPVYFVVILIAILNFTWHDHVSILLSTEYPNAKCSKYWWTNILYFNNFYRWNELCLTWSWYLPNDMQFFVFGNFLLILSITHYNIAMGIGIVTLLSSIGSLVYTGYTLNYQPTLDGQYRTMSEIYIRPWCRIPPYLIGMATCHLLTKWNYKSHFSKKSLIVGWSLAILCNCSILFGLANKNISLGLSVLYLALSRTCWALGIAWLVVACTTNNGGIVNKILSLDIFSRLSKLSYTIYLIHPVLVMSIYSVRNYPLLADEILFGAMFSMIVLISFIISIPLTAATEIPFMSLLRLYNHSQKRTK
ncbi:nose resistant to fluoxetine protein 6-like [Bombus vancouverensis nearcticus]|uniref:nose resistant to fluoxetine protein 6-like n=1 Tax=Bombus vancouverensis nearcticus TaxID=2705178 RepID=UPI00402BD855